MAKVWLHTHLPRLSSGDPDVISVKVPGQRVAYASWVSLKNVEFKVHERGRQRCVAEGVRNVHAWVVGDEILRMASADFPVRPTEGMSYPGYRRAVYDPFKGSSFVDAETLEPVLRADIVIMSGKHVFYADMPTLGVFL